MKTTNEILEKFNLSHQDWNKWRNENQNVEIELADVTLDNKKLNSFDFKKVNFKNVKFKNCDLGSTIFQELTMENVQIKDSNLEKSTFNKIKAKALDLDGSNATIINFTNSLFESCQLFANEIHTKNFHGSTFLNIDLSHKKATSISFSRLIIDKPTRLSAERNPKITIGLNGIYNKQNNSASLRNLVAQGDQMLGGNEDIILTSLNKSKAAFSTSTSAALIAFTLKYIGINSFAFVGLNINPNTFSLIALPIIFFSLYKSNLLLNDVINNVKYVQTQTGAMKIGRFPWLISRFWGLTKKERIESFFFRLLFCLHPILLFPIMGGWFTLKGVEDSIKELRITEDLCQLYVQNSLSILILLWSLFMFSIFFSFKLFLKSQKMQKPLLFDLQNPIPNNSDVFKIATNIENLKTIFSKFIGNHNAGMGSPIDWWSLNQYLRNESQKSEIELRELRKKRE